MLEHCGDCGTDYAVGLPTCPHCGAPTTSEEAAPAPRVSVEDAITIEQPDDGWADPQAADTDGSGNRDTP